MTQESSQKSLPSGIEAYGEAVCDGIEKFTVSELELTYFVARVDDTSSKVVVTTVNVEKERETPYSSSVTSAGEEFEFVFTGDALRIVSSSNNWSNVDYQQHVKAGVSCIIESSFTPSST